MFVKSFSDSGFSFWLIFSLACLLNLLSPALFPSWPLYIFYALCKEGPKYNSFPLIYMCSSHSLQQECQTIHLHLLICFLSASKCHPHKEPFSIQPLQVDVISSELGMLGAPSIWLLCPALHCRYLYILYWKLPEGRAPVLPDFILPVTQYCLAWGDTGVESVFVHVELHFLPFQNGVHII